MTSPVARSVPVMEQLESRVQLSVQWEPLLLFHPDAHRAVAHTSHERGHITPMRIRYTTPAGFVHTLDSFPYAQGSPSSAVVGNLAYFGGFQTTDSPNSKLFGEYSSDVVELYNARTAHWSGIRLSVARHKAAAVSLGDLAFFAGGITSYRATNDPNRIYLSNSVDIFNAATGGRASAALSQDRYAVATTTVGNLVLFAGGAHSVDNTTESKSNVVDIYDAPANQWSTTTMAQSRSYAQAASVGHFALFAGGKEPAYLFSRSEPSSNIVDIYNAATNRWSTATLSQARDRMGVTVVGTKAIFAGGVITNADNTFSESNAVDIFDAATGQWTTAKLTDARDSIAAATVGNLAIFAGGQKEQLNAAPTYSNVVDIYNAATGAWSTATLSEAGAPAVTTIGHRAIFGGNEGISSTTVDIFDADTGQWSTSALSSGRYAGVAAATVGDRAIFAGGFGASGAGMSDVDIFTATSPAQSLPLSGAVGADRKLHAATVALKNFGSAALAGPFYVDVFASTSRTLDGHAILLGTMRLRQLLDAGSELQLKVPISIPKGTRAGQYHLIAAVYDGSSLVPFASQRRTVAVG